MNVQKNFYELSRYFKWTFGIFVMWVLQFWNTFMEKLEKRSEIVKKALHSIEKSEEMCIFECYRKWSIGLRMWRKTKN